MYQTSSTSQVLARKEVDLSFSIKIGDPSSIVIWLIQVLKQGYCIDIIFSKLLSRSISFRL